MRSWSWGGLSSVAAAVAVAVTFAVGVDLELSVLRRGAKLAFVSGRPMRRTSNGSLDTEAR